jgi:ABC-type Mn2+/Zn2+ transport system ATPase subunit
MYDSLVIRRFYIHNFRCLENFELPVAGQPSLLLIGKNGAGKTTVGLALQILQKIARGTNRIGQLIKQKDVAQGRSGLPIRFEIEVDLDSQIFQYIVAFELPENFKEFRVLKEDLFLDGKPLYTRDLAHVQIKRFAAEGVAQFNLDWHLAALPVIQRQPKDPLFIFREWLARILILRPVPSAITGDSEDETLEPSEDVSDLGAWFSGLLADEPSAYTSIDEYLRQVMPDLVDIKNRPTGSDSRSLVIQFKDGPASLRIPFRDLSDGEKCFMICALVLAANRAYGPLLCFWDEPDNHLALSEVGHFVMALRRGFLSSGGQLIMTSHNDEAIRRFSNENTLILQRKNHLEPTIVRPVAEIPVSGDLIGALVRDDIAS